MIEYELEDKDSNRFKLNDATVNEPAKGSLTLGKDLFTFENKIVENSALHGSVKLGKTRIKSKKVNIIFSRALGENNSDFRTAENALLEFLLRTTYLVDATNNLKTPIAILDYNLDYDKGAHKLSSENEITIEFLDPFWKEITPENESTDLSIDLNEISIDNGGSLIVPPILTFTTVVPVSQLQIYVDETKEGIQIDDALFGEPGYLTTIIDCEKGTIIMGSLDRINSILAGTGFFSFPVGISSLMILPTAECHVSIDWHERLYL